MAAEFKDNPHIVPTGRIILVAAQGVAGMTFERVANTVKNVTDRFRIPVAQDKASSDTNFQQDKEHTP